MSHRASRVGSGLMRGEGLLEWCKKQIALSAPSIVVKDFSSSWVDGMAMCALVDSLWPECIDLPLLRGEYASLNLERAFGVAELHGVSRIIDVDEVVAANPELETSLITYITQLYQIWRLRNRGSVAATANGQKRQSKVVPLPVPEPPICAKCNTPLSLINIECGGKFYHPDCFMCVLCKTKLTTTCVNIDGSPYCDDCGKKAYKMQTWKVHKQKKENWWMEMWRNTSQLPVDRSVHGWNPDGRVLTDSPQATQRDVGKLPKQETNNNSDDVSNRKSAFISVKTRRSTVHANGDTSDVSPRNKPNVLTRENSKILTTDDVSLRALSLEPPPVPRRPTQTSNDVITASKAKVNGSPIASPAVARNRVVSQEEADDVVVGTDDVHRRVSERISFIERNNNGGFEDLHNSIAIAGGIIPAKAATIRLDDAILAEFDDEREKEAFVNLFASLPDPTSTPVQVNLSSTSLKLSGGSPPNIFTTSTSPTLSSRSSPSPNTSRKSTKPLPPVPPSSSPPQNSNMNININMNSSSYRYSQARLQSASPVPRTSPSASPPLSPLSDNPIKEGYMVKKTDVGIVKLWQKRYFLLKRDQLLYFSDRDSREKGHTLGIIPLKAVVNIKPIPGKRATRFVLEGDPMRWYLKAETEHEMREWIHALRSACKIENSQKLMPLSSISGLSTHTLNRKEGPLSVRLQATWVTRWIVLRDGILYVYKNRDSGTLKGKIPLFESEMREYAPYKRFFNNLLDWSEERDTSKTCFEITTATRHMIFRASSTEEMHEWLNAILRQRVVIEEIIDTVALDPVIDE